MVITILNQESLAADPKPIEARPMAMSIQTVSNPNNRKNRGLHDITLELGPGVSGLLGPNGAGKSTLTHILATITDTPTGVVTLNGVGIA